MSASGKSGRRVRPGRSIDTTLLFSARLGTFVVVLR